MDIILEQIAKNAVSLIFKALEKLGGKAAKGQPDLEALLPSHILEISNWSRDIQLYGMPRPLDIGATVALSIDTIPRRFRGLSNPSERLSEAEILNQDSHVLLLGDPGSGKTTLLKRLVRQLLLKEPAASDIRWAYPILVRLRLIDSDVPIAAVIADRLGLKYVEVEAGSPGKERYRYLVEDKPLDIVLAGLLDASGGLVLLDGLDEVPVMYRNGLEKSIRDFSLRLGSSRIILSCRSGDYQRTLEGFSLFELCPLDKEQVWAIANLWLPQPKKFMSALESVPYRDLADRPLFLCQLLILFKNTENLPDQPSSIYRSTTRLMLEDWDRRRGITRSSKYAQFSPDDKHEFLSALSYELTYRLQKKSFSTEDLALAYRQIAPSFGLPKEESCQVAEEIETHTGIVVQSGSVDYEFSHLSLQEYLCAYYLVRDPFSGLIVKYLSAYPAPIAVAVSIASSPTNWLTGIIIGSDLASLHNASVQSFISRLVQERPRFGISIGLGFAMLSLFSRLSERTSDLDRFLSEEPVRISLERALGKYIIMPRSSSGSVLIRLDPKQEDDIDHWRPPRAATILRVVVEAVESALGKSLSQVGARSL